MIFIAASPQLLASALIYVQDHKSKSVKCRALLDTCYSEFYFGSSSQTFELAGDYAFAIGWVDKFIKYYVKGNRTNSYTIYTRWIL